MSERRASVAMRGRVTMIDEFSDDGSGWARYSDDMTKRYRLARSLRDGYGLTVRESVVHLQERGRATVCGSIFRVLFVLLNPSTASAFKPDPTVSRCCEFARRWGGDVVEVVNLYALRSPYPTDLDVYIDKHGVKALCEDVDNDASILAACSDADIVVAAWGNNAWRGCRGLLVRRMLQRHGVRVQHFGLTKEGAPLHPLARGKSFVPYDRKLTPLDVEAA